MSHQIDPVILQKLQAFSQRRRTLIIIRGVCAALAMLLTTMMLVALVDWLFILPDWLRWTLSGASYAAVLFVEWRSCLRLLLHAPGPRRIARLIEHAEPKLREDLLSAVELGDPNSDAAFDSEQFRALVQSDVAHRMEGMQVERLLPVNLVRRYLGIAAAILIALIVGLATTGLEFGTLLARALLPGANLARVSRFQIHIVSPDSPEKVVPHGETVPLVVEVTGGRASKAVLETFSQAGGREVLQMNPIGADKFSATIQVARENVLYRVRAGDAITRKFRLDAVARPHVVAFAKTYQYPTYAKLPPKELREENGDLAALEGSEVTLRLETNQAIRSGELRLEQGRKQTTVPLTPGDGNQLVAKVPLDASGTYRVFLVGAQTGFENKFSPEYELRAEPDLVPQVELELPKHDLIIPANELVDVRGTASDDLALAKVAQMVRVNEGPWKEFILAKDSGQETTVERRWDLFEQGVKAGDLVTTKLLAIDLKGHRTESRPIQLTITASGFETQRLTSLEAQRVLLDSIRELRTAAENFEKRGNEARELFDRFADGDPQRKQACVSAVGAFEEFERKLLETAALLATTLRTSGAGHESHDLVLLGRLLVKMNPGTIQYGRDSLEVAATRPEAPEAREFMREFADSAVRVQQRARQLDEAYRLFLVSEEVDVLAENMHVVMKEQERLSGLAQNTGEDAAKWTQLANRLRTVTSETRALEAQLTTTAGHGQNGDRFKRLQRELEKQRVVLDNALARGPAGRGLLDPVLKLSRATTDAERQLLDAKRDLANRPVELVRSILQEVGPTWANFEKLRQEVQAVSGNARLAAEARQPLIDRRWERRGGWLKQHGDLEEARPNSDSYFVGDLRTATLALQGIKALSDQPGWEKKLAELDLRFRLLESGHNLAEMLDGLSHLSVNERWEIYTPRARTTNPRDWLWLEGRLRMLPDELGKMELPEPLRGVVLAAQKILWEAQKLPETRLLTEEMKERFRPDRAPMGLPQDVEKVAAAVKQALDLLRQPIEDARKEMAASVPKVSDVAAQLAKETEALKKETEEQAAQAPEKKPEEVAAAAQEQVAQQEKLNEKVEALKDLIRAEANKQNVLDKEGRELARDADDALAMLKEPPPKAAAALQEAARSEVPEMQQRARQEAIAQQDKLADSLQQIAQHFENVEQGKAEETRMAMRATEEETGVKAELDAQFAKAEQLAQMAQQTPDQLLKQLEQALPQNPVMQKELSQIAQDTLAGAQQKLSNAAQAEQQIAKDLNQMAEAPPAASAQQAAQNAEQAAKQAAQAAEMARQAANEAVQAAKRANNQPAADQARQARAEAQKAAQAAQEAAQSAAQMAAANQPEQAAQAGQRTAEKAGEAAQNAQQAAQAAKQAGATAQQSAQNPGEAQANNQQSSQQASNSAKAAEEAAQAAKTAEAAAKQAMAMAANAQNPTAQNAAPPPSGAPAAAGPQPMSAQNPQLAQAAQQQGSIAQKAGQAGDEVSRAGRHEERLQNTAAGQQLQQLGAEIAETAMNEVPAAQQALTGAEKPSQAQSPVQTAAKELTNEAMQLAQAAGQSAQAANAEMAGQKQASAQIPPATGAQPSSAQAPEAGAPSGQPPAQAANGQAPPGQPAPTTPMAAPASPQEQAWMARTLDMLDAAMNAQTAAAAEGNPQPSQNGQPSDQPGQNPSGQPQPGQGQPASQNAAGQAQQGQAGQRSDAAAQAMAQAQAAMRAAAQAAANAMKTARSEAASQVPGQESSSGELKDRSEGGTVAESKGYQTPGEAKNLARGEWGKLPKKVAEELTQGQREAVAGEYRSQIETYYRVIAEKAKKP